MGACWTPEPGAKCAVGSLIRDVGRDAKVQGRNLISHVEVNNEIPGPAWRYQERKHRPLDGSGSESTRKKRHNLQRTVDVKQVSGSHECQGRVLEKKLLGTGSNRKFFSLRLCGRRAEN